MLLLLRLPDYGDRRKAMLEDIAILTGGTGHLRGSLVLSLRIATMEHA